MKYLKKNKKGSMAIVVSLILVGLLAVGAILLSTGAINLSTQDVPSDIDFDGEFDDFIIPEDASGTDLEAEDAYTESNEEFEVNFSTTYDLNGTDGSDTYMAFTFETSGDMEDFQVDGTLGADTNVSELRISDVYVLRDEEGVTVSDSSARLSSFVTDLETEQDEFTVEASQLMDGEYVFVVKTKGITTSSISAEDELVDMDFEAESDDSDAVTEGDVKIENLA